MQVSHQTRVVNTNARNVRPVNVNAGVASDLHSDHARDVRPVNVNLCVRYVAQKRS